MNIKHISTKDNTAKVLLTATSKEISSAKTAAFNKLNKDLTVKGFRKGSVPADVAKKTIGDERLKQEAVSSLLESGVLQIIKEKKYQLLGLPQLDKTEVEKETTWTFDLSLPLSPDIKLGDYKKTTKTILGKTKGKTPDQKLTAIMEALIKNTSFVVPAVLIEREVNHSLSRLVKQTESLNLDLNTYFKSINKTAEQVKEEYHQKAEESIKIDLILSQIATDLKVDVTPEELEAFGKTSQTPPEKYSSLAPVLIRRKTLDQLLVL
jgi:FKBP-type peptidyl-prolyl cis-trans isomerase (trigger factor)